MKKTYYSNHEISSSNPNKDWFIILAIAFSIIPMLFSRYLFVQGATMILSMFLKKAKVSRIIFAFSLISFSFVFLALGLLNIYLPSPLLNKIIPYTFFGFSALYVIVAILILLKPYSLQDIIMAILSTIANYFVLIIFLDFKMWWALFIGFGIPMSYFCAYMVNQARINHLEKNLFPLA